MQSAKQVVVDDDDIIIRFCDVRRKSLLLCSSLDIEDHLVQSMPEASPVKWHLAHTTWFFEEFILTREVPDYEPFNPQFRDIFNSYYETIGTVLPRERRALLTRPSLDEVLHYRHRIDDYIQQLLTRCPDHAELRELVTLGLHHEQQHQELILTDIKHAFFLNPLLPVYQAKLPLELLQHSIADDSPERVATNSTALQLVPFSGGIKWIGAESNEFSFDNERPRHRVLLEPFAMANRLVTNSEYLAFVRTGGYRRPEYWLSDGWQLVKSQGWSRPLYWQESLDSEFTLHGVDELKADAPVCHLSYYEADAFARWASMRLPTELEWEAVAEPIDARGNLLNNGVLHPQKAVRDDEAMMQLYGDTWEWTSSSYSPYPGYTTAEGALGEYNGKFMCNQFVLRGGSCATPDEHIRASYRNFFGPHARWQFTGVRLAR